MPLLALAFLAVLAVVGILNLSNDAQTKVDLPTADEAALATVQWDRTIAHIREQ